MNYNDWCSAIDDDGKWVLRTEPMVMKNAFTINPRFDLRKMEAEFTGKKLYYGREKGNIILNAIYDIQTKRIHNETKLTYHHQNKASGSRIYVPNYFLNDEKIVENLFYYINKYKYFLPATKEEHQGLIPFLDSYISIIDIILIVSSYIFMKLCDETIKIK